MHRDSKQRLHFDLNAGNIEQGGDALDRIDQEAEVTAGRVGRSQHRANHARIARVVGLDDATNLFPVSTKLPVVMRASASVGVRMGMSRKMASARRCLSP